MFLVAARGVGSYARSAADIGILLALIAIGVTGYVEEVEDHPGPDTAPWTLARGVFGRDAFYVDWCRRRGRGTDALPLVVGSCCGRAGIHRANALHATFAFDCRNAESRGPRSCARPA